MCASRFFPRGTDAFLHVATRIRWTAAKTAVEEKNNPSQRVIQAKALRAYEAGGKKTTLDMAKPIKAQVLSDPPTRSTTTKRLARAPSAIPYSDHRGGHHSPLQKPHGAANDVVMETNRATDEHGVQCRALPPKKSRRG